MQATQDIPRMALVGPVLPFRGGIAQHTTMLHRALRSKSQLLSISFKRQYPVWLFPGESDRDPAYEGHSEDGVDYCIDSLNPLTWRMAVKAIVAHRPQAVVIPWWTIYWAPCFYYLARAIRSSGIKLVFFCHNVVEHESASWKQWLSKKVLGQATSFVVHTREDEANLKALIPDASVTVNPHPIYEQFPQATGTLNRRAGVELLFFGFVRPYKGLDVLIDAMALLKGKDVFLSIVGEFWEGQEAIEERILEYGIEDQIELIPRYVDENETAEYFTRADVVVLPYRSATGSGVVPLAYHYNKPVIVTRVGGLPDVVVDGETGFVIPANDEKRLARTIGDLSSGDVSVMEENIRRYKKGFTWEGLSMKILESIE